MPTVTSFQGRHSIRAPGGNIYISLTADFLPHNFLNFDQSKKNCTFQTNMVKNRYKIVEGGVTKILFYWVVRKLRARTVSNCNVECKIAIWRP